MEQLLLDLRDQPKILLKSVGFVLNIVIPPFHRFEPKYLRTLTFQVDFSYLALHSSEAGISCALTIGTILLK